MLTNDGKLDELVKKALKIFNRLTPEEQAAHWREQAISWAHGQLYLHRYESGCPEPTKEEEEKQKTEIAIIYDRRLAEKKDLSEP